MLLALCAFAVKPASDEFQTWGCEFLKRIKGEYRLRDSGLYADSIERGKRSGPAFCWGVGVQMSALNAAARIDPAWRKDLLDYVFRTRAYWNDKGPVPGYDVLPGRKEVDRYYDDNMWLVMALCEASDTLRNHQALDWAEETLKFALSGEDDKLGGGIYWHEPRKETKNACSNAPAAAACLAVYGLTRRPAYLLRARDLYAWTKKTLQDPGDDLLWDNISLGGKIDRTKWSYNTALMIRSAAELARFTGQKSYAEDAERMAVASEKRWIDPMTGAIKDGGRFAHLLLESWSYVPTEARKDEVRRALRWVHEHGRNAAGFYGGQFNAAPKVDQKKFELIDQASVARAFLRAP